MVENSTAETVSEKDLSVARVERRGSLHGVIPASKTDDINSFQFAHHSTVLGAKHGHGTNPEKLNKQPNDHQEEGEIIDQGIEAQDVDSLLDRFLEYEKKQNIGTVQSSQHDHTYAASSEHNLLCYNDIGNYKASKLSAVSSCVDSMSNTLDVLESPLVEADFCSGISLDSQGYNKETCNRQKRKSDKNGDIPRKSKVIYSCDSDVENKCSVLSNNNSNMRKNNKYSSSENENDLDEFGRNISLAKYDRKRCRKSRRYSSTSDDESDVYNRRNLKKSRNKNLENGDKHSRCDRNRLTGFSNRGSSRNNRRKTHYNIEQERKLSFKFETEDTDLAQEERRVVYIGRITSGTTQRQVWKWFREFGPIEKVTVHFRDDGDNYAFVTFCESSSALEAIENGKTDPDLDICFGGRRKYCGGSYVDFDSNTSYLEEQEFDGGMAPQPSTDAMDFDALLNMCLKSARKN